MQFIDIKNKNLNFNEIPSKDRNLLYINTPVAMFTTAYSRMLMANYKQKYKDHLYYSDTDSLVLDCQLPNNIVNNDLGNFKLECHIKEGVFLAPKVYSIILDDDTEICNIKGSKITLPFSSVKELLVKNSSHKITSK